MKKEQTSPNEQIPDQEQQPEDPGPTSGGMGSMGSHADEPSLEEKLGMPVAPADQRQTGRPARKGIAGSYTDPFSEEGRESHSRSARSDTGDTDASSSITGEQENGASHRSVDTSAPQAPDNEGSTAADLDRERSVGMSGGLGEKQ